MWTPDGRTGVAGNRNGREVRGLRHERAMSHGTRRGVSVKYGSPGEPRMNWPNQDTCTRNGCPRARPAVENSRETGTERAIERGPGTSGYPVIPSSPPVHTRPSRHFTSGMHRGRVFGHALLPGAISLAILARIIRASSSLGDGWRQRPRQLPFAPRQNR